MNTTNETLILLGQGYDLAIDPAAEQRKAALLDAAGSITAVTSNDESNVAQFHVRRLAELRIEVEKSRKLVKEPVNRIGKLIDTTAKHFLDSVIEEETRIKALVGAHAEEVARLQREKEEAERRAFDEARAAREAAEDAQTAAEETGRLADIIAAKRAETARQEALTARMDASDDLAATQIAKGVRFTWDFEIENEKQLYTLLPEMVEIVPKRREILQWLKEMEEKGRNVERAASVVGITAFKKPVISTK